MTPLRSSLAAVAAAVLLSAARGDEPSPASAASPHLSPADARASLLLADDWLALQAERGGFANALAASLAPEVVYLHAGAEVVEGRDAVGALLRAAYPERRGARTVLHRIAGGASADGERGYTFGWLEATDGAGAATYGRWVATWRGDGGRWWIDAFVRAAGRSAPSEPPPASPLLAGYRGLPIPGDPERLRADVFAADEAFAAHALAVYPERGFGPAFVAFADPNAVVVGGGDFPWGADAVEETFGATEPGEKLAWRPLHGAVAASGDLGWTVGNGAYELGEVRARSKYLTVWVRQPDGTWRWLLDLGNARP